MNKGDNPALGERRLDLGEAANHVAGFPRQRQGRADGRLKLGFDPVGEARRDADLSLQSPPEELLLLGSPHGIGARGHPGTAPGKPATEVGDDLAIGPGDKTDQPRLGHGLPGHDAGPLGRFSGVLQMAAPYPATMLGASASATSGSGGLRSASVTQPALRRACMIIASASARDRLKPSRMPAWRTVSPSLRSLQPTTSSGTRPAKSSTVLTSPLPRATSMAVLTPGTSFSASSTPSALRSSSCSASSLAR